MPDEKDRLGEKLHDREKASEDVYFAEQNRKLLEKLKREKGAGATLHCPRCGTSLQRSAFHDIQVDRCGDCGGMWLDAGEFAVLAKRENEGWLGKLFRSRS